MFGTAVIDMSDSLDPIHQRIAEEIETQGWCLTQDYIDPEDICELYQQVEQHYLNQDMLQAGIGSNHKYQINQKIRSDYVMWVDPQTADGPLGRYFQRLARLKAYLNQTLILGLYDLECQMAIYPAGAHYAKHLDCFQGTSLRTLTCILYLNPGWSAVDGGQLRIYTQADAETQYIEILPLGGQLVTFLSERFIHEVLPTQRRRASISGWFRKRPIQAV